MATEAEFKALDNPIWHSLTTRHARFGQGDGLARRFEPGIGPLAGMTEQSAEAYRALGDLLSPGEAAALFLDSTPEPPAGWRTVRHEPLDQMICETAPVARDGEFRFQELGEPQRRFSPSVQCRASTGTFEPRIPQPSP